MSAENVFNVCMANPIEKMCNIRFDGKSKFVSAIRQLLGTYQNEMANNQSGYGNTLGQPQGIE